MITRDQLGSGDSHNPFGVGRGRDVSALLWSFQNSTPFDSSFHELSEQGIKFDFDTYHSWRQVCASSRGQCIPMLNHAYGDEVSSHYKSSLKCPQDASNDMQHDLLKSFRDLDVGWSDVKITKWLFRMKKYMNRSALKRETRWSQSIALS